MLSAHCMYKNMHIACILSDIQVQSHQFKIIKDSAHVSKCNKKIELILVYERGTVRLALTMRESAPASSECVNSAKTLRRCGLRACDRVDGQRHHHHLRIMVPYAGLTRVFRMYMHMHVYI